MTRKSLFATLGFLGVLTAVAVGASTPAAAHKQGFSFSFGYGKPYWGYSYPYWGYRYPHWGYGHHGYRHGYKHGYKHGNKHGYHWN